MNRQRKTLVDRLEQSGKEYLAYLSQLSSAEVNAQPAPTEWSIHQVAAHMRDCEAFVFLRRVERVLAEEHPAFQNFDQDEYWKSNGYAPAESLKRIIADFRRDRRKLVRALRTAPDAAWKNWGKHSAYGNVSLDWLTMHCYHHTLEHVAQMGYAREKELLKDLNH